MINKKAYTAKPISPKTEQTLIDLGYDILDNCEGEFCQDEFVCLALSDDEYTSIQEHVSDLQDMPLDDLFEEEEDYIGDVKDYI